MIGRIRKLSILLVLAMDTWGAADRPVSPHIDKGACPFEGCTYREWMAKKDIRLLAEPESHRQVGVVRAGEQVTGITGEVRSKPILVHALADVPDPEHPSQTMIPKGGAFYVIHYLGEAAWLCWYKGHLTTVESFSESSPTPEAVWWVKIKTQARLVGWAISDGNFDGQDRLGGPLNPPTAARNDAARRPGQP